MGDEGDGALLARNDPFFRLHRGQKVTYTWSDRGIIAMAIARALSKHSKIKKMPVATTEPGALAIADEGCGDGGKAPNEKVDVEPVEANDSEIYGQPDETHIIHTSKWIQRATMADEVNIAISFHRVHERVMKSYLGLTGRR